MTPPRDLPIVVIDDVRTLATALAMLVTGEAYAVIYIDDVPNRPGQMTVRHWIARSHAHREPEVRALIQRCADAQGCAFVDGARLMPRGAA